MTIDVEALKASVDLVSLVGSFTPLRKRGKEYVGLCVAHADKNPSMWVNAEKRIVHCFSCDFHADAIDFIQHVEGLDFKAACERLGAKNSWVPRIATAAPEKTPERITTKPPADAPTPAMAIKSLGGEPAHVWPYRDQDGGLLGYIARYETQGGKEIRCWSWGAREGQDPSWGVGAWSKPRPLFQLDKLAARSGAPVLIVEGEKAAKRAQELLGQYVVTTWPGGARAWKYADFEPLRGRRVDIWPDNDEPGIEAMQAVKRMIEDPRGLKCHGKIIDPNRSPEGFDAADWDGTPAELIDWLKARATEYPAKIEAPPEPTPEPAKKPARPRLAAVDGNAALAPEPDAEPLPAAMSEDMLAESFAGQHAGAWRYVKVWGSWMQWRGDGWYRDDTALIDRLAVELTRQAIYWPDAAQLSPDAKRKVNSRRVAGAVRDNASNDRRIAARIDQWDINPWLLGVPGGVVDLTTGKRIDPRPDQYITKRTAVAPADGDAPIWRQFLETVTNESGDLIEFLQTFAGYCLTGETREQCLAFLYGTGQNGKGVFITTLKKILGDYAVTADADVFMETDHQRHPTEMARLRGARLVAVDETDSSKRWNEKRIKRITGGGMIEARFMRQDDFEYLPQFKLLFAGNHKPQLRGVGKAIQRRIHLIPFTVTIPDAARDNRLTEKLEAEYPQILAWMIEGCAKWQKDGLKAPQAVADATAQYIEGEDVIGEWLEERTEQNGATERPAAYKNYRAWADGRGDRAWSSKAFWSALEERGYLVKKTNGQRYIQGMSIKFSAPDEPYQYSDR